MVVIEPERRISLLSASCGLSLPLSHPAGCKRRVRGPWANLNRFYAGSVLGFREHKTREKMTPGEREDLLLELFDQNLEFMLESNGV